MAIESSSTTLDLPQIKTVLEESAGTIFRDWLSKTKNPEKHLNEATILLSQKLNQSVLEKCPSVEDHKLVVVGFATEQVTILLKMILLTSSKLTGFNPGFHP